MEKSQVTENLKALNGWMYDEASKSIQKEFTFKSYLKTISFVNTIAWFANRDNHHPDLEVSFGRCLVKLTTHDAGGVSEKDFALAKCIDSL
ncbi:4a-hydroxytetrahydrobiopterin dehydratase [Bacteriovorax stolpii]|uniref:4a-hydroxytetrahydrobiopterin dehydratase n=1 Tax=Bacteriovorax stolpii TaxID=960 RepID=A0A2K9NU76_BACTC|nr:4a-hydroxytetrahydrobiopterin dehydratase [Bacteriovorax stolpii]AUN99070.1 4a-hydroxytetrahydrobiopterin dehydratase [Bacteriovorax stolpii]QDK40936.1 4a-hydroxytetrahydrobiopterin dehydratase [Bacteriovorax stolpii]TDP55403.1 4a-hydroxytetrahydrobiopterin dehydratase [Bacteriovorax stolpii]